MLSSRFPNLESASHVGTCSRYVQIVVIAFGQPHVANCSERGFNGTGSCSNSRKCRPSRRMCSLVQGLRQATCRIVTAEPPVLIRRDGDARVRPAGPVPAAADLQHPRQNIAVLGKKWRPSRCLRNHRSANHVRVCGESSGACSSGRCKSARHGHGHSASAPWMARHRASMASITSLITQCGPAGMAAMSSAVVASSDLTRLAS